MSLARAHNRAWDREPDHFTANLIAEMSGRDLDRTISEMTDAEIEAVVTPKTIAAERPTALVDHRHSVAACADGRESNR